MANLSAVVTARAPRPILPNTKPCPECSTGILTKEHGVINEPCLDRFMNIVRKSRPATFYSCASCEYCEEV